MVSTVKVTNIDTPDNTGNITFDRPIAGDGSGLTGTSKIVQVVNVMDGEVGTTTTTIPFDNSIPQNTEGTEFLTLAITPTSATNKLRIDVVMTWSCNSSSLPCLALFQDSTASAIAAVFTETDTVNHGECTSFTHYMTSGTTSSTTFKVRMGPHNACHMIYNGQNGGRIYGGVMASSITITEIAV
jgi:hypothetical protein